MADPLEQFQCLIFRQAIKEKVNGNRQIRGTNLAKGNRTCYYRSGDKSYFCHDSSVVERRSEMLC
jgi:hypothetical protein